MKDVYKLWSEPLESDLRFHKQVFTIFFFINVSTTNCYFALFKVFASLLNNTIGMINRCYIGWISLMAQERYTYLGGQATVRIWLQRDATRQWLSLTDRENCKSVFNCLDYALVLVGTLTEMFWPP